jgi:hypothetical protein
MKYLIASLLVFAPFVSFAAVAPVDTGAVAPNVVTQVWGLTGYQTPHVVAGAAITDEHGIVDVCPSWYPHSGPLGSCQDTSHTDCYRAKMNVTAQHIIAFKGTKTAAIAAFPTFTGWINAQ